MELKSKKCPECGHRFPWWRIFIQVIWTFTCPSCGVALCFSKESIARCAEFGGLFIVAIFAIIGSKQCLQGASIIYFLLLTLLCSRILFVLIADVIKKKTANQDSECRSKDE